MDGRVEGQAVGLVGDVADDFDHAGHFLAATCQLAHALACHAHIFLDLVHPRDGLLDGFIAFLGMPERALYATRASV